MGKTLTRDFLWRFDAPPEAIWPVLADTARFNEAAKLPKHDIDEQPREDGSVLYLGMAKFGPFKVVWQETPVNWVTNRWFRHSREFRNGPLESLCATFVIKPDGAGAVVEYKLEASAANILGAILLRTGFFQRTGRSFGRLAETAGAFAQGDRATPFDYQPPTPSEEVVARLANLVTRIEDSGYGHGLAQRLGDYLLSAQEVDLTQIRPLRLAREWQVEPRLVIELCLEATRQGLLSLRWDLLCPRCRIAKEVVASLDRLPTGAHCSSCNIDYERDFSKNVELSFQPLPSIRSVEVGEYCLFGPMNTPHIPIHLTVGAGQSRSVEAELPPGAYRLRTLEPGPEFDIDWNEGSFPDVIASDDAITCAEGSTPGSVRFDNRSKRELTFVVEERRWVRDALSADRVTALQAFRDLFSEQVLRPGDEVEVKRVALMFTDLRGSTELYSKIGDASAYHLVRDHFAFLATIVREHNGAIIKTIGDAIMAAFSQPGDALQAALAVQRQVVAFNADHPETPVAIKLGLHEGPSIAVTLNDRLDYFGSTVNLTARLQSQSRGGDIVLSQQMRADPSVAAALKGLTCREEAANLKGIGEAVAFGRLIL